MGGGAEGEGREYLWFVYVTFGDVGEEVVQLIIHLIHCVYLIWRSPPSCCVQVLLHG